MLASHGLGAYLGASGAVPLPGIRLTTTSNSSVEQRTIRYGILGFGRFAERALVPAIRGARHSALVALQKRSPDLARDKADEHSIPLAFASVEELVHHPDIDAVFVASANGSHGADTRAAAEAGKHVIVEKPMALNSTEAQAMIDACRRNSVHLMVGHMVRLSPLVRRMKEIASTGKIGTVKLIRTEFVYDGRLSRRTWLLDRAIAGGGPVFDVGVHCLDTIRYILDAEPVDIESILSPVPTASATEESGLIGLRFPKDVLASIVCSYTAPVRKSFLEIMGTEGIVSAFDFTMSSHNGRILVTRGKKDKAASTTVEEVTVHDLYCEEVSMMSGWILGGVAPEIDGTNGLMNQRALDRMMKCA